MRFGAGGLSAGIAALLLTAGCKDGRLLVGEQREGEQASAAQSTEQAQRQPEQAFDQAREAQEKAADEQQPVSEAQQAVSEAWQPVPEGQQSALDAQRQQESELAQQSALEAQHPQESGLAQQAQQQTQEAQLQEDPSQQQAEEAQQPVAEAPAPSTPAPAPMAEAPASPSQSQGEQLIIGEVLTVNDRELLVSNRGEPQLRLQVQPGTVITVDGRPARAVDIEEGSQVRASFRTEGGEPTATRIEVLTSQQPATPAAPESGESSPGAQPEEPPFQED